MEPTVWIGFGVALVSAILLAIAFGSPRAPKFVVILLAIVVLGSSIFLGTIDAFPIGQRIIAILAIYTVALSIYLRVKNSRRVAR